MTAIDPTIIPDDKDWTWTLERPCPDCGFAAGEVAGSEVAARVRDLTAPWVEVLARAVVAGELAAAASSWSDLYAGVSGTQWGRPGIRSNGSTFTVLTLGRYGLHDLAHHLWDVGARTA